MSSSILTSGFIPREPEEISAEWLFEVINQVLNLFSKKEIKMTLSDKVFHAPRESY